MAFTDEQKKQLQRMSDTAPRFLFRGWFYWCGNRFIGADGKRILQMERKWTNLNSESEIRPHAFSENKELTIRKLWNTPDVSEMIKGHLRGYRKPRSEFSSWTHDLSIAVWFALFPKAGRPPLEPCISVIDRENLTSRNMAYHVDDLQRIGIIQTIKRIDFEYLVHGVVKGPGLVCVKLADLYSAGFRLHSNSPERPISAAASVFYRLDEPLTSSAIRFARLFKLQPESSSDQIPLRFFLAATWMANAIGIDETSDLKNSRTLQDFCRQFVKALEEELQAPLPEDFASHFRHAISLIGSRPDAQKPLLLLQVMTHFTWGLQRRGSIEQNYMDFKELTLKRKLSLSEEMEGLLTDFQALERPSMMSNRAKGGRQAKRAKEELEDSQEDKGMKVGQGSSWWNPGSF